MTEKTKKDIPRLHQLYLETIIDKLKKELNYNNINQVPKITKIVVSMGVGEAIKDNAILQDAANELSVITGQKPQLIKAKRSVSNFKLREGVQIGCKVTIRGTRMYEFLERLICIALPRIRDFRGVSAKAFDGKGNYSLGIDDQLIFPEVNPDKVKRTQGMNVAIVTTANNDEAGKALLREFGMPFTK
ncbi:MAG: 50S ribosomal protein L5 [Chlamydiae bacterium]|nr:MAG: 50S ribosomal protein L5 [Chlamydiota bacterium]